MYSDEWKSTIHKTDHRYIIKASMTVIMMMSPLCLLTNKQSINVLVNDIGT